MRNQNPHNLVEMLRLNVERFPAKTAMYFYERSITYQTLDDLSSHFAASLLKLGLQRAAIFLLNCPEFVIGYFGIIKAGYIPVPINNMFKQEETEFILNDAGCQAIITSSMFMPIIEPIRKRCSQLKYVILTDAVRVDTLNFSGLCQNNEILRRPDEHSDVGDPQSLPLTQRGRDDSGGVLSEDIAAIIYTSGTTGYPKGAMLTHQNFLSNVNSCIAGIGASHRDNFICFLPMFHSFAWTVCVLMPLSVGGCITIIDTLKPFRKLIRNVIKKQVTVFVGIPSVFHILSQIHIQDVFAQRVRQMIKELRVCISGAAALPVSVLEEFQEKFKVPLLEGYGLTEAAPVVSLNPLVRQKPGSVGLPVKDVQVKIVDEQDKECLSGQPGELLVKGENVMKGYLNCPEVTRQTIKDGWLYTGDIARLDHQGYIYIVDRKKDMINVRGLNVYPKEIENVLMTHPAVKEAAVVRYFDKNKGEVPRAFIVLKEKQQLTNQEVLYFCKRHLADFKLPRHIEFIPVLPRNSLGKVLKKELEKVDKG